MSQIGRPDQVVGYVYAKDLLKIRASWRRRAVAWCVRCQILVVSEHRRVGELLASLQRTRVPMAVVVDDAGRTIGLVTYDDVVTALVGDGRDEVERPAPRAVAIGEVGR